MDERPPNALTDQNSTGNASSALCTDVNVSVGGQIARKANSGIKLIFEIVLAFSFFGMLGVRQLHQSYPEYVPFTIGELPLAILAGFLLLMVVSWSGFRIVFGAEFGMAVAIILFGDTLFGLKGLDFAAILARFTAALVIFVVAVPWLLKGCRQLKEEKLRRTDGVGDTATTKNADCRSAREMNDSPKSPISVYAIAAAVVVAFTALIDPTLAKENVRLTDAAGPLAASLGGLVLSGMALAQKGTVNRILALVTAGISGYYCFKVAAIIFWHIDA